MQGLGFGAIVARGACYHHVYNGGYDHYDSECCYMVLSF